MSDDSLDALDQRLLEATQAGLPLHVRPYDALAETLGLDAALVRERLARLLARGAIRRIAAVPNHYLLGYRANGMSVWDVADEAVSDLGRVLGDQPFVTHCYQRPRHLPDWPYNLFAMVHGQSRAEVYEKVQTLRALLAPHCRASDVLFSRRILKKTGVRL